MNMFSEGLVPAACDVDISGLIAMLILQIVSDTPSANLDWNNNYGDDLDKSVLFHSSNLPKSFFQDTRFTIHLIISDLKGNEATFGAMYGRIKTRLCILLRIETDDVFGEVKRILVEDKYTDDPLDTYGGYGVIEIKNLQSLLKKLCQAEFAHHVAATLNYVSDIVYEALVNYLGFNLEYHK